VICALISGTFLHFVVLGLDLTTNLISNNVVGQGIFEGKVALYHCNYCNKDVSGRVRIKCVMCPDFDLCIECFSIGAEVTPHKSNHPYRVMVSTFLCS
jgi:hypothetical protein